MEPETNPVSLFPATAEQELIKHELLKTYKCYTKDPEEVEKLRITTKAGIGKDNLITDYLVIEDKHYNTLIVEVDGVKNICSDILIDIEASNEPTILLTDLAPIDESLEITKPIDSGNNLVIKGDTTGGPSPSGTKEIWLNGHLMTLARVATVKYNGSILEATITFAVNSLEVEYDNVTIQRIENTLTYD